MADTTAVISAADRPPTSAITMVKARKAKARLDAAVTVRSGTSTTPRISAPKPPTAIQIRLSFRAPMPLLLPPATVRIRDTWKQDANQGGTESSEPTTSCHEVPGDEHPLLIALLHELMPIEAHAPLLAEAARRRAAAPAGNGGFESQRLAQLRGLLIPLCWLPAHCALSFARSNRHAPSLSGQGGLALIL